MKVMGFARGVLTLGTSSGIGFIAVSPTVANDFASVWYSDNGYLGTSINATMVSTPGVNAIPLSNLPFSRAQLSTEDSNNLCDAYGRIVSYGLSLKYIGTEYDRGGRVMCYSDPTHESVNGYLTGTFGARMEADFNTPNSSRSKCWVTTNAVESSEMEFPSPSPDIPANTAIINYTYPFSGGQPLSNAGADLSYGAPVMGALISGKGGNVYEWEVICHVEYIGRACQSRLTPNFADPEGAALVQSAIARAKQAKVSEPQKSLKQVFKREIVSLSKELASAAVMKGGAMLLAALA